MFLASRSLASRSLASRALASLALASLGPMLGAMLGASEPPCLAIAQDRVTAADLARIDPAFATLPGATQVAYAPAPGLTRWIAPGDFVRLGRALGLTLDPAGTLAGVCLTRIVHPLDREKLLAAMRSAGVDFQIELIGYGPSESPLGRIDFSPKALPHLPRRSQAGSLPPTILWRGQLISEGGRAYPVWARARVTRTRMALVATGDLDAGRIVSAEDIARVELIDYPGWEAPLDDPALIVGRRVRRPIAAQSPLLGQWLTVFREIERGDSVTVLLPGELPGESPATLTVQAESSGRKGETVLLRNPLTGRRFPARVTGARRAEMPPMIKKEETTDVRP